MIPMLFSNCEFRPPKRFFPVATVCLILLWPMVAAAQNGFSSRSKVDTVETASQETDTESAFDPIIIRVARNHNMDPALIKAVIKVESQYDPNAVSRRGAKGLMQLMPRTAKAMGIRDLFDPEHNIRGGTRYLKKLLSSFDGEVKLALAAYNAGCTKVRQYNGVPPFKTTRRYIKKVMKYYHQYKTEMTAVAHLVMHG